jgi:hypothetical protein|tara:strand:- start:1963 stop:2493 length:531 start_codon:yes stop_codon:yes gene_type:complete
MHGTTTSSIKVGSQGRLGGKAGDWRSYVKPKEWGKHEGRSDWQKAFGMHGRDKPRHWDEPYKGGIGGVKDQFFGEGAQGWANAIGFVGNMANPGQAMLKGAGNYAMGQAGVPQGVSNLVTGSGSGMPFQQSMIPALGQAGKYFGGKGGSFQDYLAMLGGAGGGGLLQLLKMFGKGH